MNDLLALISRHGGTVEFDSTDDLYPLCTEHPEYPVPPAVAEVVSVDVASGMFPCADCLADAIETAQRLAEDAGERNLRITVTVSRAAVTAEITPEWPVAA